VKAKTTDLEVVRLELVEIHSKVQQLDNVKDLLERQLKETQVCVIDHIV